MEIKERTLRQFGLGTWIREDQEREPVFGEKFVRLRAENARRFSGILESRQRRRNVQS